MVISIVRSKHGKPWFWYIFGCVLQAISIIGYQKRGYYVGTLWFVYGVIAIISLIIILANYNKDDSSHSHYKDDNE